MVLYLVRHGETLKNKYGLVQGQTEADLSEKGISDAKELSELVLSLNIDVVISSHQYTVGKRSGTNGYVKAMYVTVEDDPFAAKYANIGSNESRSITSDHDVIPF